MENIASWVLVGRELSPFRRTPIERWRGLSKDLDKLPHTGDTGSTAYCVDTAEKFMYEKSTDTWYPVSSGTGGSSGSEVPDMLIATDNEINEMLNNVFGNV